MLSNCFFLQSSKVEESTPLRYPSTVLYATLCTCLQLLISPLEAFKSSTSNLVAMCKAFLLISVPVNRVTALLTLSSLNPLTTNSPDTEIVFQTFPLTRDKDALGITLVSLLFLINVQC